ncbi:MAG: hypothetical protein QOJ31_2036 [Gaiellales bacterium]|nr:hypothetical protein [Gaiellales bacterium]MDX6551352.1 hypothetical protein [Gaiellales bacterium]
MADDWLTLALGVLPPAPADLSVLRAEGGEAQVRLLGHSDRGLLVQMAAADADTTSGVTFVLERPAGAAFAVFGTVSAIRSLDDGDCEVLIELDEVVRWKARRRIELDLPATVALDEPRTDQHTEPKPVRLLNLSAEGAGFAVKGHYRRGDRVRIAAQLGDQPIAVAAAVRQVGRPVFGSSYVSCVFAYSADTAAAMQRWLSERDAPAA